MRAALLALAAARLGTALATAIGLPAPIDARMLPPGFEHPPMGWAMKGRSSESRWPAGCGLDPPIDAAAGALPPPSRPRCTGTGFFVTEPEGSLETDITPLLSVVIQLCAALLLAVGSVAVPWVAHRLARLIGAPHEDVIRDDLDDALHLAIAYGMWQAQARAVDLGCVEIPEAVVRHAVEYAARAVPDAIRRFGVQERLGEMITARLPGLPAEAPPVERRAG